MRSVDVWRCDLDADEASLARLAESLAADERERAGRLRDPDARRRVVAARGILRAILASYVEGAGRSLAFSRGPHGKPALAADHRLRFSSSTSGGCALVAVGWARDVGVDVERIDPRRALGPIAGSLFSGDEAEELRALPEEKRVSRFFELWTRKEALAKAVGSGLTGAALRQAVPLRLGRWTIRDLDAGPGHAAALCVEGRARMRVLEYAP